MSLNHLVLANNKVDAVVNNLTVVGTITNSTLTASSNIGTDSKGAIVSVPREYMYRTSAVDQNIPDTKETLVTWSASTSSHGITYNAGLFTLPVAGYYDVSSTLSIPGFGGGVNFILYYKCSQDGSTLLHGNTFRLASAGATVSTIIFTSAANQTVGLYANNNAGGDATIDGTTYTPMIKIVLVTPL